MLQQQDLTQKLENPPTQPFLELDKATFSYCDRTPQIPESELHLWKRQAQAIGRSKTHLQAIERLLQLAQQKQSELLDISHKTYQVRQLDLQEFNEQAFRLMGQYRHLNHASKTKSYLVTQKIRTWCLSYYPRLQHLKTWVQKNLSKTAQRIYNLIK